MAVKRDELKRVILDKYNKAKESINLLEKSAEFSSISNRIPNYDADQMDFATFNKDFFVTLFADMRKSASRAEELGPEKAFLTIHAIMPALIYIVEEYGGYVIDLPGDGIMALFKDNRKGIHWNDSKENLNSEELAYMSGYGILGIMLEVVNEILDSDQIPPLQFGVGIDSGTCVITKTGTNTTFDTKAIGTSINSAAKKSNGNNKLWLSNSVYNNLKEGLRGQLTKSTKEIGWYYK